MKQTPYCYNCLEGMECIFYDWKSVDPPDKCINSVCARFDKATYDTRVRRTLKLFKEELGSP